MVNGTVCSIKTVTTNIPIISEVVEQVVYSVFIDHVQPWPARSPCVNYNTALIFRVINN